MAKFDNSFVLTDKSKWTLKKVDKYLITKRPISPTLVTKNIALPHFVDSCQKNRRVRFQYFSKPLLKLFLGTQTKILLETTPN